ncbi:MAG TPA: PRC-barrel domain-containing protein [Candidatus Sulfotelmatobacter sp.]|nr:PRC-barrel domain-containing protein [Candidatus Sulfotelmatobacter sp.]HWI56483.1 PRC-barrel domain-containing protein [Bacillota bacterium]
MLRQTKELLGYRLGARDGEIGHIKDLYFDDQTWTVRYLVADTGNWLPHRKVLISPIAVTGLQTTPHKVVAVNLTRQQIEESPSIETHKPVSRQYEAEYLQYYGWPYYWPGPLLWGPLDYPGPYVAPTAPPPPPPRPAESEDSHLRSIKEVTGYHLQALDQAFGHVEQFILEDENWAIRYLVADTRNWWPGKHVLLAPQWLSWVSWSELRVYVDFDRATVQRAPEYNPAVPITREFEEQLFAHYNREPYWKTSPEISTSPLRAAA